MQDLLVVPVAPFLAQVRYARGCLVLDVGEQLRGCLGEFVRLQQRVRVEEGDHTARGSGAGRNGPGQGTRVPLGDRRGRPQPGRQSMQDHGRTARQRLPLLQEREVLVDLADLRQARRPGTPAGTREVAVLRGGRELPRHDVVVLP